MGSCRKSALKPLILPNLFLIRKTEHKPVTMVLPEQGYLPFGLQTGNNDEAEFSSYVASMAYNDVSRELTITGGTYGNYFKPGANQSENPSGSDCFVAILHLPHQGTSGSTSKSNDKLSWVRRRQFGNSSASEFCSAVKVGGRGRIIALGHSGEGSIFQSLLPYGNSHRSIYGMILELDDKVELKRGMLLHSNQVQYPVAVALDPTTEDLYVAQLFSEDKPSDLQVGPNSNNRTFRGGADLSTSGYSVPSYGIKFSVRLQHFSTKENSTSTLQARSSEIGESFHSGWSREFGTLDTESVQISSLSYASSSALLLGGYTHGSGSAFGMSEASDKGTLDGFVTAIDPSTGNIVYAKRIESLVKTGNDWVLGLCRHNDIASSEVFVVGMTDGVFDSTYLQREGVLSSRKNYMDAFLLKLDLNGMEILWSRQIGGVFPEQLEVFTGKGTEVHGTACVVTPDGNHVYMAGNVKDGTALSIVNQTNIESLGSNDIFISKFRSEDGILEFAKQVGSSEDDSLAQGDSLATDSLGNLILVGNTRGSMYRRKKKTGIADIFTMSISTTGAFVTPFDAVIEIPANPSEISGDKRASSARVFVAMTLLCCGLLLLFRRRVIRAKERMILEEYLAQTQVTTISESVTGGWHATDSDQQEAQSIRKQLSYGERRAAVISDAKENNDQGLWNNVERQERRKSGREEAYGEIYNLLSLASKRLSLDSEPDVKPEDKTTKQQKTDESLSRDDMWDKEILL